MIFLVHYLVRHIFANENKQPKFSDMKEREINKIIIALKDKNSRFLNIPYPIRCLLAERLQLEIDEFINNPLYADEDDVLEALLNENNY